LTPLIPPWRLRCGSGLWRRRSGPLATRCTRAGRGVVVVGQGVGGACAPSNPQSTPPWQSQLLGHHARIRAGPGPAPRPPPHPRPCGTRHSVVYIYIASAARSSRSSEEPQPQPSCEKRPAFLTAHWALGAGGTPSPQPPALPSPLRASSCISY
jgi:hypothetical protein